MKKICGYFSQYVRELTVFEVGLLKFCVAAMGVIIGMTVPRRKKKAISIAAGAVFALTYPLLILKFVRIVAADKPDHSL